MSSPTIKTILYYISNLITISQYVLDAATLKYAASPDGIFNCKCQDPLVVEVKCLYRLKEMTNGDYIDTQNDTCLFPDHSLKKSHAYYHQVQLQCIVYSV